MKDPITEMASRADEIDRLQVQANLDAEKSFRQLSQYFASRAMAAKRVLSTATSEIQRIEYQKMIDYCNTAIKLVLGL